VRDGMNLVAHEYVLCQGHERPAGSMARGSLVLSEFAGAALSLTRSLQINPWDTSGLASAMSYALSMPESERADRMSEMYERVVELDSARWARRYLDRLDRAARHNRQNRPMPIVPDVRSSLTQRFAKARRRRMFLDYDGTLRELAQVPEQAAPTPQILDLVRRLTEYPQGRVGLQVASAQIAVKAFAESIDDGRVGLQPHAPAQSIDEHARDQRPFVGRAGFLFDQRGEDQSLLRGVVGQVGDAPLPYDCLFAPQARLGLKQQFAIAGAA
jgi:hypothetical protein